MEKKAPSFSFYTRTRGERLRLARVARGKGRPDWSSQHESISTSVGKNDCESSVRKLFPMRPFAGAPPPTRSNTSERVRFRTDIRAKGWSRDLGPDPSRPCTRTHRKFHSRVCVSLFCMQIRIPIPSPPPPPDTRTQGKETSTNKERSD
jgi:hypothetical protein